MELTDKIVESTLYEGRSYMSKSGRKRWAQHILWDERLPGFGLRITPTNRKSFIVTYRAGGRKRTKTLGPVTKMTLSEARDSAAEFLGSVADKPPAAAKQPALEGVETVAQLAAAYLEGHLKKNVPSWFADQRLMRTHINPAIGRAPIAEVSPPDLASLANRVSRRFPADGRRLRTLLEGMFDWAADRGLWSRSTRKAQSEDRAADGSSRTAEPPAGGEAEPASLPVEAELPAAEELLAALESSEEQRNELTARLEEISSSGAEMLAQIRQQASANQKLEAELASSRRALEKHLAEVAKRPSPATVEKQTGNLRQSVEQLLDSLRKAEAERETMTEKLAAAESRAKRQTKKAAALVAQRNKLESRALELERLAAIRRAQQKDDGRWPKIVWPAAGIIAGVLLTLLLQILLGSDETAPARPDGGPPSAAADVIETPAASADGPDGRPPPAGAPPAVAGGAAAPVADDAEAPRPDPAAAEAAVRAWASAWSEQRIDDYLAAYSTEFRPPDGLRSAEWVSSRRNRIQRPAWIRVTLDELAQTAVSDNRMRVSFRQSYETDTFSDQVDKTLELVWEDGGWKIAVEQGS